MFHERRLRAWLGLIAVTLVVAGIAIGSGANQRLQWALQDGLANALRSNAQPHPKVKLILIDDASVNHLSDVVGRYPWPRGIYGPIIEFLNEGGAQHIIFDILFSEQESSMSSQQTFVEAIRNANNVSAVGLITADIPLSNSPPPFLAKSIINVDQVPVITQDYQTLYHPIPAIAEHLKAIPIANATPDNDGIYRRLPLYLSYQDQWLTTIPLTNFESETITPSNHFIQFGNTTIPTTGTNNLLLHWYPTGIQKYSFSGILSSWQSLTQGREPLVSPTDFKDCIVIIGASAVGLHDLKATPIHSHMAGAEIQATAISNLLLNDLLWPSPVWLQWVLVALLLYVVPAFLLRRANIQRYFIALGIPALLLFVASMLYSQYNMLLDIALPLLVFFTTYFGVMGINSFVEYLEKQQVKQTFSMYVSPKILDELSENYKTIQPEIGKEREMSILFTDIRNFTTLTEETPVADIIALLNDYFDAMIEIIQANDGTVDKMIGDAIMAFWNAPIETENHAFLAVKTAQEMQLRLAELNEEWKQQGRLTIDTGIGINTGRCIVGNIGSKQRVNYTVIGDVVNATARLEAMCKNYDDHILISKQTYDKISHQLQCEFIDNVHVKGKAEPIQIYAPRYDT